MSVLLKFSAESLATKGQLPASRAAFYNWGLGSVRSLPARYRDYPHLQGQIYMTQSGSQLGVVMRQCGTGHNIQGTLSMVHSGSDTSAAVHFLTYPAGEELLMTNAAN